MIPYFHVFEVKEDGISLLPLDKSLANECFKTNKMIGSAAIFTKSTLNRREKLVFSLYEIDYFRTYHVVWQFRENRPKDVEKSVDENNKTRMWANAQPDGRPAKYRWRPLFNVAKFG